MPYYAANSNLTDSREKAANQLNEMLTKEVEKMNKHSQHLELDLVDVHKLLDDIIESPDLFGLKNAHDPFWEVCQGKCTENPDSYVWWDKTHLTGGVHRLIANSILMAGSLAPETYLSDTTDVLQLIPKYQSPVYKAQKSKGQIETIIAKLKEEKEKKDNQPATEEQEAVVSSPSLKPNPVKSYLYFGVTATLIVCIVFILFIKTKRRGNHLAALSGLIHKPDRARFLPLHNMDSNT